MFKWFSGDNRPTAKTPDLQNSPEKNLLQRDGIKICLQNIESFAFQKESTTLQSLDEVQKLLEVCFELFPKETLSSVQKLLNQGFDIRQDVYIEILLSPSVQKEILQKNSPEVVNQHLQGKFQKRGSFRPNPASVAEQLAATHFLQEQTQPREKILERALKNPEEALLQLTKFEESLQNELVAILSYRNPEIVSQILQGQLVNIGKQLPPDTVKKILLGFLHIHKEQKLLFLGKKENSLTRPEITDVFKEVTKIFHQDLVQETPKTEQPIKKREFHPDKYISATQILRKKTLTQEDVSLSAILDFTSTLHAYPRYAHEPWAGEILAQVIIRDEHEFVTFFEALCKSQTSYNPTLLNPLIAEGVHIFPDSLLVWTDFCLEKLPDEYKHKVQAAVREATRIEILKNNGKPLQDKSSLFEIPKDGTWAKTVCSRPEYFTDNEVSEALSLDLNSPEALAFIEAWYRTPIGKKILEQAVKLRIANGNSETTFDSLIGYAVLQHIDEHSVEEIIDACLATKTQPDSIFNHPQAVKILKKLNLLTPFIISIKMDVCPIDKEVLKTVFSFKEIVKTLVSLGNLKNSQTLERAFQDLFTSKEQAQLILEMEKRKTSTDNFSKIIKIVFEKYPTLVNEDNLYTYYKNIDEGFLALLLKNPTSKDVIKHLSSLLSRFDNVHQLRTGQENAAKTTEAFTLILTHPDSLKILKIFKENNIQIPYFTIQNLQDLFSPEMLTFMFSLGQLCEFARRSKEVKKNVKEALNQKMTENKENVTQLLLLLPKQDFEKYCGDFLTATKQNIDSLPKIFFETNFSFTQIFQLFLEHPKTQFLIEACKNLVLKRENFLLIWDSPDGITILKSLGLYTKEILSLCPDTVSEEVLSEFLSAEEIADELWKKSYPRIQGTLQSVFVHSVEKNKLTDVQIAELCEQTIQKYLSALNDPSFKRRDREQWAGQGLENFFRAILALAKTQENKIPYQDIVWKIGILCGSHQRPIKKEHQSETVSPYLPHVYTKEALKELGTDSKTLLLKNLEGSPTHLVEITFSQEELLDLQKQYPEAANIRRAYETSSHHKNALAQNWLENPHEQHYRKLIKKEYDGRMHELVDVFQRHLKEVVLANSQPRHTKKGFYFISPEVTADHTDLKVMIQVMRAYYQNSSNEQFQNILKQLSAIVSEAQTHLCAENCDKCTPYEKSLRDALATRFTTYQTMCKNR